jgi:hypothetical protein
VEFSEGHTPPHERVGLRRWPDGQFSDEGANDDPTQNDESVIPSSQGHFFANDRNGPAKAYTFLSEGTPSGPEVDRYLYRANFRWFLRFGVGRPPMGEQVRQHDVTGEVIDRSPCAGSRMSEHVHWFSELSLRRAAEPEPPNRPLWERDPSPGRENAVGVGECPRDVHAPPST